MLDINALFIKKNRHDKNKFCAMSMPKPMLILMQRFPNGCDKFYVRPQISDALGSCQISMMEFFYENSQWIKSH